MRKYLLAIALLALTLFSTTRESKACISDTITTIIVTISFEDSISGGCTYAGNVEIRLSNLRLMSESPGQVCACALTTSWWYDSLIYIAFVDSGTNNPYAGFAAFNEDPTSSAAWNSAQPGDTWGGFVASVINSGLIATDPVELVIRARAAPNTLAYSDSGLCINAILYTPIVQSSIGTDSWDSDSSKLGFTHQKVRPLNVILGYNSVASSYFTAMDTAILNNIPVQQTSIEYKKPSIQATVVPNPWSSSTTVSLAKGDLINAYWLYDMEGRVVEKVEGLNTTEITIERKNLPNGMYFLEIRSGKEVLREKLIVH